MKIITICRSLIFVVVAMVSICGAAPPPEHTGVFINRRELTRQQVVALQMTYHYAAVPGRYWYDPVSGAWGLDGHEAVGFLMPGHNFGPMPGDASHGSTGCTSTAGRLISSKPCASGRLSAQSTAAGGGLTVKRDTSVWKAIPSLSGI